MVQHRLSALAAASRKAGSRSDGEAPNDNVWAAADRRLMMLDRQLLSVPDVRAIRREQQYLVATCQLPDGPDVGM